MASRHRKINVTVYTNIFLLVYLVLHFTVLYFWFHLSLLNCVIDTISFGLFIFLLSYVLEFFNKRKAENILEVLKIIGLNLGLSVASVYLLDIGIEGYITSDYAYQEFLRESLAVRGILLWVLLCHSTTIHYLITDYEREQEEARRTLYNEELKKEAELFKLRQQINPHFLFNTLNSINALISIDPQRSRSMVQQLSQYFRNTIRKEDHQLILVSEEIDDLRLYFEIEKVRFGHRLNLIEKIDNNCLEYQIPPFLIQPLVENAIKHGLYGTTGTVDINYELTKTVTNRGNTYITFTISNPYDAQSAQISGTGFGLKSIERRLYLLFARNDLLQIEQTPSEDPEINIFTAHISIPVYSESDSQKNETND